MIGTKYGMWYTIPSQLKRPLLWEQIHLNMYTTHSYNKWHKSSLSCPLCTQTIDNDVLRFYIHEQEDLADVYFAVLYTRTRRFGWRIFCGSIYTNKKIWLTYVLRFYIHEQEDLADVCFAVLYTRTRRFGWRIFCGSIYTNKKIWLTYVLRFYIHEQENLADVCFAVLYTRTRRFSWRMFCGSVYTNKKI